jgi:hypothetical protein
LKTEIPTEGHYVTHYFTNAVLCSRPPLAPFCFFGGLPALSDGSWGILEAFEKPVSEATGDHWDGKLSWNGPKTRL